MTTLIVKKQFETIYNILKANEGKKLSKKLMDELTNCMISKGGQKTFKLDDEGNVTHIFCYYHKEWEEVSSIPYGKKSSTAHGLNTMCKEGVSNWTKQQRRMKQEKDALLQQLLDGTILQEELQALTNDIEARACEIIPHSLNS